MESVKPGDDVELRVYSQGQTRTVRTKAVRAADLRGRNGFFFDGGFIGGDGMRIFRAPSLPLARPLQPSVRIQPRILYSSPRISVDADARVRADARIRDLLERTAEQSRATRLRTEEAVRRSEEAMRRALETRLRQLRWRADIDDADTVWEARSAPRAPAARAAPRPAVVTATAAPALSRLYASTAAPGARVPLAASAASRGLVASVLPAPRSGGTLAALVAADDHIVVSGLRLAPVESDLASYLGEGTERGLMVLERSSRWPGLHEGDVILAIDGRSVRGADGSTRVALRSVSRTVVDVVRGGKRIEVTIDRE
jgi:hypothetical protein